MKIVKSKKAPEPIGPYSQAVVVKNLVFVSGMIALDPATGKMVSGGVKEQTERVLASLKAVLKQAGTSEKNVAKTTVFLADIADYPAMNDAYMASFGDHRPARSAFAVAALPMGALVEIEAWAYVGG